MKKKFLFGRHALLALSLACITGGYGCGSPQNSSDKNDGQGEAAEVIDGGSIYKRYCSRCHSMGPPPKYGPPIKGIAIHYREAFTEKKAAVEHMVAFMQKPDASLSKCRPEAIRRFGLMPAMNLSEEKLSVVSEWLWEQFDPELKRLHDSGHHH
ncbi:cytochrome c [Prosthecochloris sp. SCSIO W1101]|uniref:c-type cytochrome n=1 Tax=Prosthecochloris sp. SCSIO W1101 TaxID=2992242 RepID=UPI00223E2199|nr:c-type cytochrome [Prosthecochloris sp. SCSIO W1101]UZJ40749.1 cytochrome c [Prosthecochloris sp. SCSIO W1101]